MQVKSILYHQTIPTGSYANEKLGVEIELSEGDTPEQAFAYAKEIVEKIHRENNPQLFGVSINNQILPQEEILYQKIEPVENIIDAEFESIKEKLNSFEFREDAEDFILTTDYKMAYEARQIINKLPKKNN